MCPALDPRLYEHHRARVAQWDDSRFLDDEETVGVVVETHALALVGQAPRFFDQTIEPSIIEAAVVRV